MDSLKELCVRVIIALNIRIENPIYADVVRDSRALELLREDTAHHVAYLITRRIRLNVPLAARTLHHGHNREKWIIMSNSSELSNVAWYITFIRPMARITRALYKSASTEERIKLLERFGVYFKSNADPQTVRSSLELFKSLFHGMKKGIYVVNYY
jgi:hypothetical protein